MDAMNRVLMGLSTSARNAIWYGFIFISAIVLSLLQYHYGKKNNYQSARFVALLSFIAFCALSVVTYGVSFLTNNIIFPSGSIYFVPYLLMVAIVLNKTLKIPFISALDQTAIANVFARAVTITGCSFAGCCQGYTVSWGIYSALRKETAIPVRMIEQIFLLGLWLFLDRYYKKHGYNAEGICAAVAMILFGLINVVTDIFTVEKKLFCMTSVEGIFAFITMCVGLIMLYIFDKKKLPRND